MSVALGVSCVVWLCFVCGLGDSCVSACVPVLWWLCDRLCQLLESMSTHTRHRRRCALTQHTQHTHKTHNTHTTHTATTHTVTTHNTQHTQPQHTTHTTPRRYLTDGLVVMAAMPTTVSTNVVFTKRAHGNEAAALVNAVIGNIIGIFITPLWLSLFLNLSGQAPYAQVGGCVSAPLLCCLLCELNACVRGKGALQLPARPGVCVDAHTLHTQSHTHITHNQHTGSH